MFSGARRYVSYANVVATLALLFAMSGGALAAKHYLLSSTKQISPKVLKALKGNKGATGTQGPAGAQGKEGPAGPVGTNIVDRARGVAAAETSGTVSLYGLSDATWSQGANEAEQLIATWTLTAPPESKCGHNKGTEPADAVAELFLDGQVIGEAEFENEAAERKHVTGYFVISGGGLVETGAVTSHTLTAKIVDDCETPTAHFTIESINVDVVGIA